MRPEKMCGTMHCLNNFQYGITEDFDKSQSILDQNNYETNPWISLTSDTIALSEYTDVSTFVLVDATGQVMTYYLDMSPPASPQQPQPTLTPRGALVM